MTNTLGHKWPNKQQLLLSWSLQCSHCSIPHPKYISPVHHNSTGDGSPGPLLHLTYELATLTLNVICEEGSHKMTSAPRTACVLSRVAGRLP